MNGVSRSPEETEGLIETLEFKDWQLVTKYGLGILEMDSDTVNRFYYLDSLESKIIQAKSKQQ